MSEPEYLNIHDRIREKALQKSAQVYGHSHTELKEYEAPKQSDLDEIKQALKYILETLTKLDRYVRDKRYQPGIYEKNCYEKDTDYEAGKRVSEKYAGAIENLKDR